jgi:hypothetical protein
MKRELALTLSLGLATGVFSCQKGDVEMEGAEEVSAGSTLLAKYTPVKLTADLSALTDNQKEIIKLLIEAGQIMDGVFWKQAYGDREALLDSIADPDLRRFAEINYGPWDRLDGDAPFIEGVGPKPKGANFYPADMSASEFEQAAEKSEAAREALTSLYTLIRRDDNGELVAVPYREAFADEVNKVAEKLVAASELAEDPGLKKYLSVRAEALLTDDYQPSDFAWMDMKSNTIDVVIGPVETYEDKLFGYKAAHETFVLIKDREWSERLARYTAFLPELQKGLPVAEQYKQEVPGGESELNAYDVVYYAGDCNAGSKTIAINLPNDPEVQLAKGARRLQLKNAMRAKFDKILVPIAEFLIAEDQQKHISFDAFFQNTMFHEVAHGLGIKNTITGKGRVRTALKEQASALEEGKADILGLYMITRLIEKGELVGTDLKDNYVTFMSGIIRQIRFGSSSAHGRANLMRFNFFKEQGAFSRDTSTGRYRVDFEKMSGAVDALSEIILTVQGDGDYEAAKALVERLGQMGPDLRSDLDRLASQGIPTDITFEQGMSVLQ